MPSDFLPKTFPKCLPDIRPHACDAGHCLPLAPAEPAPGLPAHRTAADAWGAAPLPAQAGQLLPAAPLPLLPSGAVLFDGNAELFQVTGQILLPAAHGPHALRCPLLTALCPISPAAEPLRLTCRKKGRSLAWITLSDKGSQGLREDLSGPALAALAAEHFPSAYCRGFLLPDDAGLLRALLTRLALEEGYDLICTTGGTGLSVRDTAPQATQALLDLPLPGFTQAMLTASLAKTPHAVISRAAAGVLGASIIINLPGSRKAALENLAAVLPALPHALDKLHGDPADCGG